MMDGCGIHTYVQYIIYKKTSSYSVSHLRKFHFVNNQAVIIYVHNIRKLLL